LRSMPIVSLLRMADDARAMRAAADLLSNDRQALVRQYLGELAASGVLRMEGATVAIA